MSAPTLTRQPRRHKTNIVTMTEYYQHRQFTPTREGPNQGVSVGAFAAGGTAARGQLQINPDGSFTLLVQ